MFNLFWSAYHDCMGEYHICQIRILFTPVKNFFQTSSLARMVKNPDFVKLVLCNFNRLNKTFPHWYFKDLNTATSSGCNKSVVWAGNLITVICFPFANWIVPYHRWNRWSSNNNKRGPSSSVICQKYIWIISLFYKDIFAGKHTRQVWRKN